MTSITDVLPRPAPVPVVGPVHIPKLSWFEFILNNALLERHLSTSNPDPSAGQLICEFLLQASRQVSQLQFLSSTTATTDDVSFVPTNMKIESLKILALKVAAFFQWELNTIEKNVPNGIVQALLLEFKKMTIEGREITPETLINDQSSLPDHILFSHLLYHRWCLRTLVKNSFINKPNIKTGFLCAPDFGNYRLYGENIKAVMYNELAENASAGTEFLEKFLKSKRSLVVPSVTSIETANELSSTICHDWTKGQTVSSDELIYHTSFDLAVYYFYKENYAKSLQLLHTVRAPHQQRLANAVCALETEKLEGYFIAANEMLNVISSEPTSTIQQKVLVCKSNGYKGIFELLLDDMHERKLSADLLDEIERDVSANYSGNEELCFKVSVCNYVRKVCGNGAIHVDLSRKLSRIPNGSAILIQVLKKCLLSANYSEKCNIQSFIWYILQQCPFASDAGMQRFVTSMQTIDTGEPVSFSVWNEDENFAHEFLLEKQKNRQSCRARNKPPTLSETETKLLCCYDPAEVQLLIGQLSEKWHCRPSQITQLTDKWKLSKDLIHIILMDLSYNVPLQMYIHVLLAKAKLCIIHKLFQTARHLLQVCETSVKDLSFKLLKIIRWEVTLVDMKESLVAESQVHLVTQGLSNKAKTCLTALRLSQEIQPSNVVLEYCCVFLLSVPDWEYMCGMQNTGNSYVELSRLISAVCKDLALTTKAPRHPAKALWDTVVAIFVNNFQSSYKAPTRVGSVSAPSLFSPKDFTEFIIKITNPTSLTVLISCMAKLYNVIREDITSTIHSDFIALWPANISSSTAVNIAFLSDCLSQLLRCSIQLHPTHASWLRTLADICFAQNHHAFAMKYYLEAGVVSTDFFSSPVTTTIYDDAIINAMIKCCSQLKSHTLVAVLCQLLDSVDYITCFSALQERQTNDAMDTYYQFIWDTNILEFLICLHTNRAELAKRHAAVKTMSQLDLNTNNPPDILAQAILTRKHKFLRALSKQFL